MKEKNELSPKWREEDGVIYFSVTSDGTTGEGWIERLENKRCYINKHAKSVLCSKNFKPTSGVTSEIAILRGSLFEIDDRITHKIRTEARKRKFIEPNIEVACLIREMFTDEQIFYMNINSTVRDLIVMHEPVYCWNDPARHEPVRYWECGPALLWIHGSDNGPCMEVENGGLDRHWWSFYGFVFVIQ